MMMPPALPPRTGLVWPLERAPADRRYRDGLGEQRPATGTPVRHHAGIDLRAGFGELVRAMAPGRVLATIGWSMPKGGKAGPFSAAVIVGDEQGAILYGALHPGSWTTYGLGRGTAVKAGDPIGTIGRYPDGSSMLHISAHAPGTRDPQRWYWGKLPPADLRDIRPYLDAAKAAPEPWTLPSTEDVGRWLTEHLPAWPTIPSAPTTPAAPASPGDGAGLLGLLVLAAFLLGEDQ